MSRILPVVITLALIFLAFKILDIANGKQGTVSSLSVLMDVGAFAAEDTLEEGSDAADEVLTEVEQEISRDAYLNKREFTQIEIDLLQSLTERRLELEKWADEISIKQNVLHATETKINKKLQELKSLKSEVEEVLAAYQEKEDTKLQSLVKIYENMKPKNAAQIFEEMEMPILLEVVDKMKEAKAALVLAKMQPVKAKEVTTELALRRRLPNISR